LVHISGLTHPGKPGEKGEQTLEESDAITKLCEGFDLVALLGYMKKVRGSLLDLAVVNTHPGPLPETAGLHGIHIQERVLELGLTHSAQTLHYVVGEYDSGKIIAAHPVPVVPGESAESLFDAVQVTEKAHLPVDLDMLLARMKN
jgi:phosphoribosylglycinamide formyltransferase 1